MNFRRLIVLILLLVVVRSGFAQVNPDSSGLDTDNIDQVIEDAITDIETDDQTDWTIFTDFLEDLERKPLNLNTASKEELLMLPGMTKILVNNLFSYITEFGKLTSMYELQAVPGFDFNVFQKIRPYVVVKEIGEKDIGADRLHPRGPSFKEIVSDSRHELMLRYITLLEQQKGFTPPDTNSDGSLTSRYLGNRARYYARYRMRYNQNFSLAFVGEKDQGEEFKWDPQNNFYGFDFTAGHIFIKDFGNLKRLVVGDFNIQAGQGMLLSTGLGFGKGSESVNAVKRANLGVRPYASVNENQFMRGAAATVAFDRFYFTGFFSRMSRDANISALDSITDDVQLVSTLQTSGLHRTESELFDKDAILETLFGGRVEYKRRWLTLGATHYFQNFGSELVPADRDYNLFDFAGDQNFLSGLDFDVVVRNFNFFGEVGRSKSGGIGATGGFLASLHPKVDVALVARSFARDFHAFRGFVFAERPTAVQNERGVYLGLKVLPTTKWTFSAYYDQFVFPWHNFQVSFPSRGHEFLAQLQYKPNRNLSVYLRWRSDSKERNASELPVGQQVEMLVPTRREALRLHFQYKLSRNISIRTRVEHSWYQRGLEGALEEDHTGFLAYQDLVWKIGWKWKITGRYAIFDAEDFDARIYAYENDILGFFSIPAYSGIGTRYYALINFKPVRGLEFWARFARSKFHHENVLGSSLTEIQGNTRTEVKLQMRLSF